MLWIVANIHRIMIVSDVLTVTMIYAAIAPEAAFVQRLGNRFRGRSPTSLSAIGEH